MLPDDVKRHLDTPPKRAAALIGLAILAGGAGWVAGLLVNHVYGRGGARTGVELVSAAAVAIAVWKIVVEHWRTIAEFVRSFVTTDIERPLGQLALAATGAALVVTLQKTELTTTTIVNSTFMPQSLLVVEEVPTAVSLPNLVSLPLFRKETTTGKTCAERMDDLSSLDASAQDGVRYLACGLRSCSTARKPVRIDVLGFASSRDFDCDDDDRTDDNLELAELRRKRVIKLLTDPLDKTVCPAERVGELEISHGIDPPRWNGSREEMEKARRYSDRVRGSVLREHEILTRRVDIVIENAGICEL